MAESVRIVPIACPFGKGGTVYVYYVDAPRPALIDTGVAPNPSQVVAPALAAAGVSLRDVRWILATHGHWDHIGGARTARELAAADVQIALHSNDAELLGNRRAHVGGYAGMRFRYIDDPAALAEHDAMLMENLSGELIADRSLADGDRINLGGGISFSVVHTPGHSAGSVTFVLDGPGWAFSGDSVQVCGMRGNFPLLVDPVSYRDSVRKLLEDVRPSRLFVAHRYTDADGNELAIPVEGGEVSRVLRNSLDMEERIAAAARQLAIGASGAADLGTFVPAASALSFDTNDPKLWPPSIFATLSGYLPGEAIPPPPH